MADEPFTKSLARRGWPVGTGGEQNIASLKTALGVTDIITPAEFQAGQAFQDAQIAALQQQQSNLTALVGSLLPGSITLQPITIENTAFSQGATFSVNLVGKSPGSTVSAASSDGSTLTVSSGVLSGAFSNSGAITVSFIESLPGSLNSPNYSSVNLNVAAYVPMLGALDIDDALEVGIPATVTIVGWTAGSTITTTIPGMNQPVFAAGAWTMSGTPTGSTGSVTGGLVETLAGYTNSPNPSTITVQAPALGTLSLDQTLQLGNATTGNILGATPGSIITKHASLTGLTINSTGRTYIWSGTGSAGTVSAGLTETLVGAVGSPKDSQIIVQPAATAPTISLSPITAVAEGSAGAPGVFTITATRTTSSGPASVNWAVSAGFAGNPVNAADFGGTFPSGVLNFADGQLSASATFPVAGDNAVEPDETGLVTLSSPTSPYVLDVATQSFLVVNDDSSPTISLNVIAPRAEGSSAFPAVVNISAVRSNSVGAASCAWAVSAGGGANPLSAADFQGGAFPSGTLNWTDGQTTASASFTMVGDSVVEPDESGLVTISSPSAGYIIGTAQQPFIIQDDDAFQPLAAPIIAGLGASRVRQSLVQSGSLGANLNSNHVVGGMLTWIQALDPRYTYTNWIEQTAPYINSSYHDGLTFASDGEGFPQMRLRVPKLRSSRANIVMMDLSSNSVNGTYDLNTYCNQAKELITLMRAVGKVVGVLSLVERVSTTGGLWAVGQQWRTNVPTINAEMQSWCATQQGVFFVDIRSVLVDLVDSAHEPLAVSRGNAYDATRDGTHWSQRGAYEAAKKWNEAAAPFISGSAEASRMVSGGSNKYSNPNFTGSNPVASQANLSGVQPNNCTVNYNTGNASTVAMSLVDRGGGKFGLRATINRSAMADGTMEGIGLSMTAGVSAFVVGKWYTASLKATTNNAPGLATICATQLIDGGNKAVRGGCGINGGGSATVTNYMADLPGEVRTGKFETSSLKAINTGVSTFGASASWGKGDGSTLVIDFFDPTVIEVDDPHLLMFDVSDVSTPTITSNADFSFPEEAIYTIQGAGSKPGYWSLTGTDAALFRVTNWGEISNRAALDYENPGDADKNNVYALNLVLTPFDIRDAAVTKAMTWTATDIDDGFSDNFGRTVGMSLGAEVPQQWRPTGAATSPLDLQVGTSNRVKSVNTGVSDKTGTRLAPRQLKAGADNYEQRISFNRGVTASTAFPQCFVVYKDDLNYISVQADTTNFLSLWRRAAGLNSGARTKIASYAYDDAYGINILVQRIGSEIQVFQGGVRLSPVSGGNENIGTILQDAYDSGLGNWGALAEMLGFWNNRNAVPLVNKIGLKKLTAAVTSISVADASALGVAINNLTDGTGRQVKTVTGSGAGNIANVFADGASVKIKEGTVGETYTITLTELPSDPINTNPSAGRDSTLATITLT